MINTNFFPADDFQHSQVEKSNLDENRTKKKEEFLHFNNLCIIYVKKKKKIDNDTIIKENQKI